MQQITPEKRATINAFKSILQGSVWSLKPGHTVNVHLREPKLLLKYNDEAARRMLSEPYLQAYSSMIPEFQRDNNKWTQLQQIRFIENLCAGVSTTLMLYTLIDDDGVYAKSKILDGLQRITAILAFIQNEFPIFGRFYFSDLDSNVAFNHVAPQVHIYTFTSELEAVNFYIDINRGITHSPEDIHRAEQFKAKLMSARDGVK